MAVERRKDSNGRVLKDGEYQRSNGTYEYKWKDVDGNRHSAYAKTLSELRKKEEEISQSIHDGLKVYSSNITLDDIFNIWIETKRGIRTTTLDLYYNKYEGYIKKNLGNKQLKDIKKSTVKLFYNQLLDDGKKVSTIGLIHSVLRQILQMAVDDGYIKANPTNEAMKDIKNICSDEDKKRTALTYVQQKALEKYLMDNKCIYHRWYPIIVTLLWTGMRFGECAALTWDNVDFENHEIYVQRTMIYNLEYKRHNGRKVEKYSIHPPKTKAGKRTIPMLPIVREALLMEKQMQKDAKIKVSPIIDGVGNFVFLNGAGNVYNNVSINNAINRIIMSFNNNVIKKLNGNDPDKQILLPHFSCHSLRHTAATRMCEAGVNVKAMQDILGHSSYEITMDIYTEATSDYKKIQMSEFASYFKDKRRDNGDTGLTTGEA